MVLSMSLLLLPALSPPVKRASWWTAYRETLEQVLKRLQPLSEHEIARLDVAIVLTPSFTSTTNRASSFALFQDIFREVYSLICVSAGRCKVELDFPGGIDARVFFLDIRPLDVESELVGKQHFSGPVIDPRTFVNAKRPYRAVYVVESEEGERVLRPLLQMWRERGSEPEIQRLPGGSSITTTEPGSVSSSQRSPANDHRSVANGGTFDHLHIGHKLLLAATVYLAEPDSSRQNPYKRTIIIGITGDELLVNKKHGSLVESWEERQQRTAEFMDSILVFHPNISSVRTVEETDNSGPNGKNVKVTYGNEVEINYTRISDPFGPTITVEEITGIVVSAETRSGGKAVNDKRIEKGWQPLEVFEVDVLDAEIPEEYAGPSVSGQTFDNKISSTDIRKRLEVKAKSSNGRL